MRKMLRLTLACSDYDRTRPLLDGRVTASGIELVYLPLCVQETFFRMLKYAEFDIAEMSLSSYVMTLTRQAEMTSLVAIPVFPSKAFRHSFIFINNTAGIHSPRDLIGKRVGMAQFQMTAAVWQRGVLASEYGVPIEGVHYFTGAVEGYNRSELGSLDLPDGVRVTPIQEGQSLSGMLAEGELDALYGAAVPSCYREKGQSRVSRLFPDYVQVEKEYFSRFGFIPIMHLIVIRREVYDQAPWVAQELTKAFVAAKEIAYAELAHSGELKVMLPWLVAELEETWSVFGGRDYWNYGVKENYTALQQFLQYSYEQGLSKGRFQPEELFAKETVNADFNI